MKLSEVIRSNIATGLLRRSVDRCSKWAERYRVMGKPVPGPWSFKYHPWLREMHDSKASKNVGQKSAQMGYTEWALNTTFYTIDVLRTDCLYVLPNKSPDASDFSSARFDAALELSPHLSSLFSDVRNVGHKRAGSVNLYVRGSRSRGGMKSIPVGHMTLDEYDEMDHAQVVLAVERMSGQFHKQLNELSTPTIPNWGINAEFLESTQEHFMFRCPACSRQTELVYPDCLVITAEEVTDPKIHESYIRCKECQNKLEHGQKFEFLQSGIWVPQKNADPDVRGFYINQLYSSTVRPVELARAALKAQIDPTEDQEFNNSKLGNAYVVKGARIEDQDIVACIGSYPMQSTASAERLITMGVDVGTSLHVEIDEWTIDGFGPDINTNARPRVIHITKVRNFEDLDSLMRDFQVLAAVIDMFPERRKAKEFADRFYGYVRLCFYGRGQASKTIAVKDTENIIDDFQITVDRTSWLDLSLGRFQRKRILVPRDTPTEYKEHLKNQVRVYQKDKDGNPVGRYETTGPDHYGHARNYAEIALPLAASIHTGQDIGSFL